jgi:hypothetical protein
VWWPHTIQRLCPATITSRGTSASLDANKLIAASASRYRHLEDGTVARTRTVMSCPPATEFDAWITKSNTKEETRFMEIDWLQFTNPSHVVPLFLLVSLGFCSSSLIPPQPPLILQDHFAKLLECPQSIKYRKVPGNFIEKDAKIWMILIFNCCACTKYLYPSFSTPDEAHHEC